MRMRAAVVALLGAAVLTTACAGTETGTPVATGKVPSSSGTGPGTTTTAGQPPRPRDLTVDGVDPCTLVDRQQAASAWAVDRDPEPGELDGTTVIGGSPTCSYGSFAEQTGFLVVTSPQIGVRDFLEQTGGVGSPDEVDVAGYPAVVEEPDFSAPERGSGVCFVFVDIADDQMLSVQFSQIAASEDKRLPVDTLCAKAREVASAAMSTLQGG